ncbi:hypothetical protein [Mesorhizobium sp. B1-1-7]|uniref:hypothetical protein n=1 Tax=Mesorhizobium sp. B1-1-7 TaxID=2589977 RepID=UPI0011291FC8|nr:hypothetical protein [Mesorhizobium sp. B1-1-7]TPN44888.1 hypothetical protein FJ978_28320 [Mesorhizobium sp. B1-1-7]
MSRSGYIDDMDDQWAHIRWRDAVKAAIRGKRGQAFLREMLAAMDALPEKKLVSSELETEGQVCAIGSVGRVRGIDMQKLDPEDIETVAATFGISEALAREIVFENDEAWGVRTDEERFVRMRQWIKRQIRDVDTTGAAQ